MYILKYLITYLPNYKEIEFLLENEQEAAYIFEKSINTMQEINEQKLLNIEETYYLVLALVDKCWERIHTGHFSNVPQNIRQIYALANYFKIFLMLFESDTRQQIEKCNGILDDAMLIGCTQNLYKESEVLRKELMTFFDKHMAIEVEKCELPVLEAQQRQQYKCDIPQLECPSVDVFNESCFLAKQPTVLLNTIKHWPALIKWRDLNYIRKIAGNRTVPIEIGSNYATDEWSQQLIKINDFLNRQFSKTATPKTNDIEYLAQHELFEQITELKADIRIPDYCSLGMQKETVDIKAWLGPSGTISPMHFDPKHNLLCQVFGLKKIILAAPNDTDKLYPHNSEFLNNTSQLDAANINYESFPLAANVKFYELTLQEGDCLYMPPKWWHYVRALTPSFSVSFWWE